MTTLQELVLNDNLLQGPLPPSLGNLKSLKILILSANNFTGSIPDSFANLRNVTKFRMDGSTLSGKLPEFIGNWTNLEQLYLQGTSMQGPIPSTISMLNNLKELFISDLSGPFSSFPNLTDLPNLRRLVLRNCLLTGSIPDYIGKAVSLKTLDLSFNSLTGTIPDMRDLPDLKFTFLNNNSLTGQVPLWIMSRKGSFDLSYNNYTGILDQLDCSNSNRVNVISSYSPANNNVNWCFKKSMPCVGKKPQNEFLYINCGGDETSFGNKTYVADRSPDDGISTFFSVVEKWGYSSTGVYVDNENADYVASNNFKHNKTADIYETARVAPQSLKYYGFCMVNGNYNVTLHFAEIKFSNDETFASLGRRIFDISIQGKIVRRDFDIVQKAGGVYIGTTEVFDNVTVNGNTLEIHLYWSGKGTTAIPKKGVYGPLISGIAVTLNYPFPQGSSGQIGVTGENSGLSRGLIAGIVVSLFVVLLVICVSIFMIWRRKDDGDPELRGLDLQTGSYTLRQIKLATNNFNAANKIGEGGFGPVYKGILTDGGVVAVKQLSAKSMQGNREFVNEIGMISALQHPNLVKLFGCCMEGNQLLLVYEYLENNSLARALFGTEEQKLQLDWKTRRSILLGIAKGLTYLHEESRLKIVHRDIKATNVLLDKNLNAKISDFGLAKLHEEEDTHISTRIAGTRGYMAPEYATRGYLTDKADVYSFGIVVLETVSGRSNTSYRLKGENVYLVDWAFMLQEQGDLLELVDPELSSDSYSKEEADKMLNLSLLCANPAYTLRPLMSSVVKMMEGKSPIIPPGGSEFASSQKSASFRSLQKMALQDSYNTNLSWGSNDQVQRTISTDDVPLDSSSSIKSKVDHANDDDDDDDGDDDHDDIAPPSSSGRHL
ncbi:Probable LRR receptor-like serine/threonine-protein kinase At1g53440 [Linum grandiflorum]